MCLVIKGVRRDTHSTCNTCGGMDAYKESKNRPQLVVDEWEDMRKQFTKDVRKTLNQ